MADIEAILQAKIAEENQLAANAGNIAMVAGGGLGGIAGLDMGIATDEIGKRLRTMVGKPARPEGLINRLKPGNRMAGGLVGLIVGRGLGKVIAQQALQTDAGSLLAKAQAQGGSLNEVDKQKLQNLMAEYYNSQGLI